MALAGGQGAPREKRAGIMEIHVFEGEGKERAERALARSLAADYAGSIHEKAAAVVQSFLDDNLIAPDEEQEYLSKVLGHLTD